MKKLKNMNKIASRDRILVLKGLLFTFRVSLRRVGSQT